MPVWSLLAMLYALTYIAKKSNASVDQTEDQPVTPKIDHIVLDDDRLSEAQHEDHGHGHSHESTKCCKDNEPEEGCCKDGEEDNSSCCQTKKKPVARARIARATTPTIANVSADLRIIYATTTGTAKRFATLLAEDAKTINLNLELHDLATFDPDNFSTVGGLYVFIVASYEDGQLPENARWFQDWLADVSNDFRESKALMRNIQFAVFGLGDSLYGNNFNKAAKTVEEYMLLMKGQKVVETGLGDQNVLSSKHAGLQEDFEAWKSSFWLGAVKVFSKASIKSIEVNADGEEEVNYESSSDEQEADGSDNEKVVDLEDLGGVVQKLNKAKAQKAEDEKSTTPREMVTPLLRESLTKQGYRLVGSHSGVKLCRWTKSMLRGRGGCYKHTFYGIESHRCMETTPSLACANKCVFCWRHHTNPVGTEWKWKMDDAETIINGVMANHYDMLKQFKGVPGALPDRVKEASVIKHCALSLVGEPIMYPEINRFLEMLHERRISSFLVTNAQFPDAIKNLTPVCQLYVSVDAASKESLKKIDRPLFKDFWPRYLDSLKALADKGQRTVYRLTLVKAWNAEELRGYADLVSLGKPNFIEVKGVTFCGDSKASTLTMQNVPWHDEVINFVQKLVEMLPEYEIASEHEHSNCLLLAHKKFKIDGRWYTWIDYEKFHELVKSKKPFVTEDYMAPTPDWAVFGNKERGFDPQENRFMRKPKTGDSATKDLSGC